MTLEAFNDLDNTARAEALYHCCGSTAWVKKMLVFFPVADKQALLQTASRAWHACTESDWLEAFAQHPRIGTSTTNAQAAAEQSGTSGAPVPIRTALAEGNLTYEEKFGYIYIVCATGKSAMEMLELLEGRLNNTPEKEMRIAMGEQEKITRIRLEKLLA